MKSETLRKGLCVWCRKPLGDDHKLIYQMVDTDNRGCKLHDGCGNGEVPWSEETYHSIQCLKVARNTIAAGQLGWFTSVSIINTMIKGLKDKKQSVEEES